MLNCTDNSTMLIMIIPVIVGLFVGFAVDDMYFQDDREAYINSECGTMEKINAFTCPAFAETMPLWIPLFPLGFMGASIGIHMTVYYILDNRSRGIEN